MIIQSRIKKRDDFEAALSNVKEHRIVKNVREQRDSPLEGKLE